MFFVYGNPESDTLTLMSVASLPSFSISLDEVAPVEGSASALRPPEGRASEATERFLSVASAASVRAASVVFFTAPPRNRFTTLQVSAKLSLLSSREGSLSFFLMMNHY